MFTLCCSLLSVQEHYIYKDNVHTLIKKYFNAKNANNHQKMQGCHTPSICKKHNIFKAQYNEVCLCLY